MILSQWFAMDGPTFMPVSVSARLVPADAGRKEILIVACDRNYPPFTQLGADGKAYGMLIDLWRLWAEKTDRRVEFLMTDWPSTLAALEDGKADFHSGLFHTAERSL